MRKVAITGISGYIGNQILQRLDKHDSVESIIGIDLKLPRFASSKLKFYSRDICRPFTDIFIDNKVSSAIHLAFAVKPTHDHNRARIIDIDGANNFMEACRQASVGQLIYMSSHSAYGPHPDNPNPLTEESLLRPIRSFQYSRDKAEADRMFQEFAKQNPNICVSIVRACPVIGPHAAGSVSTAMFKPVMMRLMGYNPQLQFVHEDDIADLLVTLLKQKLSGAFNAAGDGWLSYKDVIAATGKRCIVLPAGLISPILAVTWTLRLQVQSPPGGLEFIKYPAVLSTDKLKEASDFKFRYNSRDALMSYLSTAKHQQELE